jgi:hypothetical protein
MRILFSVDNLAELLGIKKGDVRLLAGLGVIPSLDQSPIRFDKSEIDEWLASGQWEKHKDRYVERVRGKGLWV